MDACLADDRKTSESAECRMDVVRTVAQCCDGALTILNALDGACMDNDPLPDVWPLADREPPADINPDAVAIMYCAMRVLTPMLAQACFEECSESPATPKSRLMFILTSDFFLLLGEFAEA